MPDTTGAQFQEVLEVGVDTAAFSEGLARLESIYSDFLKRIAASGGTGSDIINISGLASVNDQLQTLTKTITTIATNLGGTLSDITNGITETLTAMDKTITEKMEVTSKARIEQSQTEADKRIADAKRIVAASNDEVAVSKAETFSSFDGRGQKFNGVEQPQFTKNDAARIADELKLSLDIQNIQAKLAAEEVAIMQKRDVELATLRGKQLAEEEKMGAKASALWIKLGEERIALEQKRDLELAAIRGRRLQAEAKAAAEANAAQIKLNEEFISIMQKRDVELAAQRGKAMAAATPNAPKTSLLDTFFSKQSIENIAGMVLGMGEFLLIMKAVQLIFDTITLPFKLVSEFLHDGWEYATNLQKTAADLQGVIASTVTLSSDMATNYKLAGEASVAAVQQLQLISAQTGIAVEQLQSGFKAVLEGGGASFVKDFSELPRLAELFGLAVKATGKDFMVQRTLISEIPGLLAGTEAKTSLILHTLGLTQEAWEKIRVAGLAHQDLVERLEPLLRPFLTVAEQSELRMSGLNSQLELMKNQISAAISQPVWDAWLEVLKDAKQFLTEHKDSLVEIGRSVASLLVFWGKIAIAFAAWVLDLKDAGKWVDGIADALNFWSLALTKTVLIFDGLSKKMKLFFDFINSPASLTGKGWTKLKDDIEKVGEETDKATAAATALANLGRGGLPVLGGKKPPPTPVDNLAKVKEEYAQRLKEIKDFYSELDRLEKAWKANGIISETDLHTATMKNLADEKAALTALNTAYIDKAKNSGGKPKAVEAFQAKIGRDSEGEQHQENLARIASEQAFNDFKKKLAKGESDAELAMNKVMLADEIAAAKQFHADRVGYIARLEAQARQVAFTADIKALEDKKTAAGNDILAVQAIQAQIDRTTKQKEDAAILDEQVIKRANFKEAEDAFKRQSANQLAAFKAEEARVNAQDKYKTNQKTVIADQQKLNDKYRDMLNTQLLGLQVLLDQALATEGMTDKVKELNTQIEKLNKERDRAAANVDKGNPTTEQIGATIFGKGPDGGDINSLKEVFDDGFGKGIEGLTHAFKFFSDTVGNFINAYKQGSASGGVLGGLGAVAGQAGGLISSIPGGELAGGIISGIGSVMSIVGSLFTAAAKRIAKQIKEQFDQIVKNYQNGTTNLVDTISQLEAKRAEAISRLSGQKGGQDQLNQLLPQFDDELQQLKKQQTDIITNFENALNVLRINNEALATFLKTWQDINKQVKDYLDAGGDVNKANEFLSLSLQQAQHKAQDELNQGEQQAIQDALQLNDLLTQRVNLIKDFKRQEFDLLNADSLERRQTGAVSRGQQLSDLRAQFDVQLKALDDQIGLTTQKVAKEQEVFDIAKSVDDLHRLDDQLTLAALDEQITKYKALKDIIAGIAVGPNGLYGISPALAGQIGTTVNNINVTVNGAGSSNQDLADTIVYTIKSGFGSTPFGG